jgi:hypothetical protein
MSVCHGSIVTDRLSYLAVILDAYSRRVIGCDAKAGQFRALQLRHLIDQLGTELLQRFSRAYGPFPLSMDEKTARRYQEAGLYMRQSHAEPDLEGLGRLMRRPGIRTT